jgi:hypothetical protein
VKILLTISVVPTPSTANPRLDRTHARAIVSVKPAEIQPLGILRVGLGYSAAPPNSWPKLPKKLVTNVRFVFLRKVRCGEMASKSSGDLAA